MRRTILLSASAAALATALAVAPAQAFDEVDWDWELDVDTNVYVDVNVKTYLDPSGAVISEVEQKFSGTQDADAKVVGVINNPPRPYYRPYVLDGAMDLPEVTNVAAALGNSNSISSEVSVQSDVYQSTDGGTQRVCRYYHCYSYTLPANLSANAHVARVVNASVDNAAQAIANSNSITVDAATPGDQLVISNTVQYAYANGDATASVYGVRIYGYDDLGSGDLELNRPIVSNAAIAAGNINSITVVAGSIPTPDDVD